MALRSRIGDEQTSSLGGWLFADLFLLIMVIGLAGFNITAEKGAPSITTGSATNVTASSATLNALADAGDATASVFFRWGKSANLGDGDDVIFGKPSSITAKSVGVDVQADLAELEPDTKYYFQAVAKSSVETVSGEVKSFITDAITKGECSDAPTFIPESFQKTYSEKTARNSLLQDINTWVSKRGFVEPKVAVALVRGWTSNPAGTEGSANAKKFFYSVMRKIDTVHFNSNTALEALQNQYIGRGLFSVNLYFVEVAAACAK
jgi:hypothetical protein